MRNVIFYLRTPKAEKSLIMLRINDRQFSGGKFVYSTHEHIRPEHWKGSRGKGQPKAGIPSNEALSFRLKQIEYRVEEFMRFNREEIGVSDRLRAHLDGT